MTGCCICSVAELVHEVGCYAEVGQGRKLRRAEDGYGKGDRSICGYGVTGVLVECCCCLGGEAPAPGVHCWDGRRLSCLHSLRYSCASRHPVSGMYLTVAALYQALLQAGVLGSTGALGAAVVSEGKA